MTTNPTQPTDTTTTPEPPTTPADTTTVGEADINEAIQAAEAVLPDHPGEGAEPDAKAPTGPAGTPTPAAEPVLADSALTAEGTKTPWWRRPVVVLGAGLGLVIVAMLVAVVLLLVQGSNLGQKVRALEDTQETNRLAAVALAHQAATSYETAAADARTAVSQAEALVTRARTTINDADQTTTSGPVTLDQVTQATDVLDQALTATTIEDLPPIDDTASLAEAIALAQTTSQATLVLVTQTGTVNAAQATLATLLEVWEATQLANAQTAGELQAALDAYDVAVDRLATTIDDYESFLLQIGDDGDNTARQMLRVLLDEATTARDTPLAVDATIEDVTKATETLTAYDSALQEAGDLVAGTLTSTDPAATTNTGSSSGGQTGGSTSTGTTTKPGNSGGNTSNNTGGSGSSNQASGLTGDALCKSIMGDTAYYTGVDANGTTQCRLPEIVIERTPEPNYVNADDVRAQLAAAFPAGTPSECSWVGGFAGDGAGRWVESAAGYLGGYGPAVFQVTQVAPDWVEVKVYSCPS